MMIPIIQEELEPGGFTHRSPHHHLLSSAYIQDLGFGNYPYCRERNLRRGKKCRRWAWGYRVRRQDWRCCPWHWIHRHWVAVRVRGSCFQDLRISCALGLARRACCMAGLCPFLFLFLVLWGSGFLSPAAKTAPLAYRNQWTETSKRQGVGCIPSSGTSDPRQPLCMDHLAIFFYKKVVVDQVGDDCQFRRELKINIFIWRLPSSRDTLVLSIWMCFAQVRYFMNDVGQKVKGTISLYALLSEILRNACVRWIIRTTDSNPKWIRT